MTLAISLHPTRDKTTLVARYQFTFAGLMGFFDFETFSSFAKPTRRGHALEKLSVLLGIVRG